MPVSVPGRAGGVVGVGVAAFLDDVGVGVAARVVLAGDGLEGVGDDGAASADGTSDDGTSDDGVAPDDSVLVAAGGALGAIDDLAGALIGAAVEQPATMRTADTKITEAIGRVGAGAFRDALL